MEFKHGNITLIHGDCMEYMESMGWKADLAIVDPPYGIGDRMYGKPGGNVIKGEKNRKKFFEQMKSKKWDSKIPDKAYFDELFRVSKNQIIFGGNYFPLPPTRGVIVWDKMVYVPTMSQVELAWTSFDKPARLVKIDNNDKNRLHPTQKPVALYKWLLTNYAKKGDRIIDTHGGSMSIAIACYDLGFELVCIEKDKDYFNAAVKRFKQHIKQAVIKFPEQPTQPTQATLQL